MTKNTSHDHPVSEMTEELLRIGHAWVRYGVEAGDAALRTSAQSLEGIAKVLVNVAETLKNKANVSEKHAAS